MEDRQYKVYEEIIADHHYTEFKIYFTHITANRYK